MLDLTHPKGETHLFKIIFRATRKTRIVLCLTLQDDSNAETIMENVEQNSVRAWLLASRPKTLTGACIPVIAATAQAMCDGVFRWQPALVCLLFACLLQIAANMINDLFDYLKGSDRSDRLGPERACAQGWITVRVMRWGIACVLTVACALGCLLFFYGEAWVLLSIGVACVVFAFLYTTLLSYCGMGDILVLVFFGFVPVTGTYYVQAGCVTPSVWLTGASVGILIDTLLVLNNFRDRDADKLSGKRTLIVIFGERFGNLFYLFLGVVAWACGLGLAVAGYVWVPVMTALYLPVHYLTWRKMMAINRGRALNAILGQTSMNMFLFGILMAIGFLLS